MNISSTYVTPVNTGFDPTGKRIVTIDELKAESGFKEAMNNLIEVNGELVDVSTLDRISFEGLYTPTFSTNVENGLKYQRSCFDFTNSWEFPKLTAAEDFTGMSPAEIYKAIYEKYQYCYGKNFYYADAISYPTPPSEFDDYNKVIRRFEKEVAAALGGEEQAKSARREALYGDVSGNELRQAIIDSFNLEDGLTFRELYQMTYDMWKAGLDGGLHNRLDDLFYDFSTAEARAACDNIAAREQYLDTKVSGRYFTELQKFYDNAVFRGNAILPEYSETLDQIRAACGAGGGISVSSVSFLSAAHTANDFQWTKL